MGEIDISHVGIIQWTVAFFFSGVATTSFIFWVIGRGLRKFVKTTVAGVTTEIKTIEKNIEMNERSFNLRVQEVMQHIEGRIKELDMRKVELIVYTRDKEAADVILKSVQTTAMCDAVRHACQDRIFDKLSMMDATMKVVLANQAEFEGVRGKLDIVIERQKHVIERLDAHINGSKKA